jgi:superfamily I DNA/RNA helicase
VLAPTKGMVDDIEAALTTAGIPCRKVRDAERKVVGLSEPSVKLMTIHGAKGLDFPLVFAAIDQAGLNWLAPDVQRRLLYVTMTRAAYGLTLVVPADDMPPLIAELDTTDAIEVTGPEAEEGGVVLARLRRTGPHAAA